MPPARPSLYSIRASSSSSQIQNTRHTPIHQLYPLFAGLTFHIVPAKIGETIGQIYSAVDELGGKCVRVEQARLIVTELRGRPRLIRAIGREWVVSPHIDTFHANGVCRIPSLC